MTGTWILLHEIEGPINLGSVCRAMANTGFEKLRYTGELEKTDFEARKYAVHARPLLEDSEHCQSFNELIGNLDVVFGFSPRGPWSDGRNITFDLFHQHYSRAANQGQSIGLLFGNEARGLTNQQLSWCQYRVALPAHESYVSMNLAQAALVVLWEIHRNFRKQEEEPAPDFAGARERDLLLTNIRSFLEEMEFLNPQNPEHLWQEIVPIFRNREWTPREVNLLQAIFGKGKSRYRALERKLARRNENE